jgi:hypothetical protein
MVFLLVFSTDVHTPILKEYSLYNFVCCEVRRDLAHNLLDWSLSLLLACFTSLVDNYQVSEAQQVRLDDCFDP